MSIQSHEIDTLLRAKITRLREEVCALHALLPANGLVAWTSGNVSARVPGADLMVIKPSGLDYEDLTPESMVLCDLDGKVVEGEYKPSSDTGSHAYVYRHRPDVGGVVHTHSTYATAWAQARLPIPVYGTTHADHLLGDVPCTPLMTPEAVERDYEAETGAQIIECFRSRDPEQTPMVLVAGHGPFAWGRSASKAVYHGVVLEELAKIAAITKGIEPNASRLPDYLVRKHFERKHGAGAYYGQ